MVSWTLLSSIEEVWYRSFSSHMAVSKCMAEGYDLAVNLRLSPYVTGVFTQPPLYLVAHWYLSALPLSGLGLHNVLVAFTVHQIFLSSCVGRCAKPVHFSAICVALLTGHRLGLEELSLIVAVLGASRGTSVVTLLGLTFALYSSPALSCLLVWPLFKVLRSTKSMRKPKTEKSFLGFILFALKLCMGWLALLVGSTFFLTSVLRVREFQAVSLGKATWLWMTRAYFGSVSSSRVAVDHLAPSVSLSWYFEVQMFPEMRKMFAILMRAQPFLMAAPLATELGTLRVSLPSGDVFGDIHLLVSQLLVCNLFRDVYTFSTLCIEVVLVLLLLGSHQTMHGSYNSSKRGKRGVGPSTDNQFSSALLLVALSVSIVSMLLWATHLLWIYYGVANSNYFWAMGLCFALIHLYLAHAIIRDHGRAKTLLMQPPQEELSGKKRREEKKVQ